MKDFTIRREMQFTQNAYKTLAVIICFSYSFQTNAQSGQKWATDGNTLKDSTEFLGTKNNFHLTFKTNGFERMRLTNAGNLGIGVWYPTSLLTVGGFIESTTGGFKFPDGTVQTTAANFTGNVTDTIVISKTITIQNDVVVENNMNVGNTIQVGDSSMYMGKTKQGTSNSLWTDNGDLYIQSSPDYNFK